MRINSSLFAKLRPGFWDRWLTETAEYFLEVTKVVNVDQDRHRGLIETAEDFLEVTKAINIDQYRHKSMSRRPELFCVVLWIVGRVGWAWFRPRRPIDGRR